MSPEQLLGSVDFPDQIVVADFEAGIGTLTRLGEGHGVDAVLVVVEPTPKSLEVGTRLAELAGEKSIPRVVVVANRLRTDDDRTRVRAAFEGHEIVEVDDDPAIVAADRQGVSPVDAAPDSPTVQTISALANRLVPEAG